MRRKQKRVVLSIRSNGEPYLGFSADVERLAKTVPPHLKVAIKIAQPSPGNAGEVQRMCDGRREFWEAILDPGMSLHECRECLIHEWAHCLADNAGGPNEDDHGPYWGVAYAACYRAVTYPPVKPRKKRRRS